MTGYLRDIVFHVVPADGREWWVFLDEAFTDAKGHAFCDVQYDIDGEDRTDILRVDRSIIRGYRPKVTIDIPVITMDDHYSLSRLADAFRDSTTTVFLSLDGGAVYRPMRLTKPPSPAPHRRKTFAGATFRFELRCAELIDFPPPMATEQANVRQFLEDGGFETWVTSSNLHSWTEEVSGGTVAQDTSNQRSGASCVSLVHSGASQFASVNQSWYMEPGHWYRCSAWVKGASTYALGAELLMVGFAGDGSALNYWNREPQSWGAHLGPYYNVTTSYAQVSQEFRVGSPFTGVQSERLRLYVVNRFNAASTVFFDDAVLEGPILPTGVASW